MALDPADKKRAQELFSNWIDIQEQRKSLTATNKEVIQEAAQIFNKDSKKVTAMFRNLKKKMDDGQDELVEIQEMTGEFEN